MYPYEGRPYSDEADAVGDLLSEIGCRLEDLEGEQPHLLYESSLAEMKVAAKLLDRAVARSERMRVKART